jgi:hypothetical protein
VAVCCPGVGGRFLGSHETAACLGQRYLVEVEMGA